MNAIEIKGLTKRYRDVTAVDNLNLYIEEGELFALLGVNGAGKTTTIKMLSCLLSPTSGTASVCGHDIAEEPMEVKSLINVSPQETAVAPNLSVRENLELICGLYGFDKEKTRQKTDAIIGQFNLSSIVKKPAKTLSGGWQRRLSIAMALISEPKVLFLDEPTLGLDVLARRELWEVIRALKGEITIILTTHYLEEAESLCDRIAIMRSGQLAAVGTAQELMAQANAATFEDAFVALCTR